jgi:hypothetical protein
VQSGFINDYQLIVERHLLPFLAQSVWTAFAFAIVGTICIGCGCYTVLLSLCSLVHQTKLGHYPTIGRFNDWPRYSSRLARA